MNQSFFAERRAVFCTLSMLLCLSLHAQSFLHRYRNTSGSIFYSAVHPMADGRIAAGGNASTPSDRALLTMLDVNGNVLWNKIYGEPLAAAWGIEDMTEMASGELLVLVNGALTFGAFSFLTRLSAQDGQVLSAQRFGDNSRYAVYHQIAKSRDGYILPGAVGTDFFPTGFSLLKTDVNGNILWQRTVRRQGLSGSLRCAVEAEDGHIWAAAALEDSFGGTLGTFGLFHFDEAGNLIDAYQCRAADPLRKIGIKSMVWQPGVGPVVGCSYYNDGPVNFKPLVIQLDTDGNTRWSKIVNSSPYDYTSALLQRLDDGHLMLSANSQGVLSLGMLAKLTPSGDMVWMRDLTTNETPEGLYATKLDDVGNIYGVGISFAPLPALARKGFVFKTDDPNFDKASCCSRPASGQMQDVTILTEPLVLSAGNIVTANTLPLTATAYTLQRQQVCSPETTPTLDWADSTVCPGQCITIRINPAGNKPFTLTVPGGSPGTVQVVDSATICFPNEGVYNLLLDDGDCIRTTQKIKIQPITPDPFALSDTLICPGKCISVIPPTTGNPADYIWTFEGGQPDTYAGQQPPEICYGAADNYVLQLAIKGCGAVTQDLEVSARPYLMPNAFTPDGDGFNDTFLPLLECPDGDYLFRIYNRWGQQIFSSTEPTQGWDGTVDQFAAPIDVYIWTLDFGEINAAGQQVRRTDRGQVSLIR